MILNKINRNILLLIVEWGNFSSAFCITEVTSLEELCTAKRSKTYSMYATSMQLNEHSF